MHKQYKPSIQLYLIIPLMMWSLVMIGLALWKIETNEETTHQLAENQARANFYKDKAFRFWLTGHGRIYIPVTENYQPDPYLAQIPDRDITTASGLKLSMINPARVIRELNSQFNDLYGIAGRVTSLTPLRPENAPDAWEKEALLQLEQGVEEVFEYSTIDGEPYLRLVQPLPIKKGCLLCHQYLADKTNGVGGGVTIALPIRKLLKRQDYENTNDIRLFSILWLIGVCGLFIAFSILKRQTLEKAKVIEALTASESHTKAIMESALDCIISIDKLGIVIEVNPATLKTFGYSHTEMVGNDLAQLIIPQDLRSIHHEGLKRVIATGESKILDSRIETTALHADGHQFPIELAITRIDDENNTFFTAYLRDLTEAHKLQQELTYQASHDALTGLMNRRIFEIHLEHLIEETDDQSEHCLLFLDLDQFKVVNDSSGHLAGDELLRQISQLLQQNKRASDTLARLGGDEFALLLEGCPIEKAKQVASILVKAVQKYQFYWEDKMFTVGISIGLVPVQGRAINYSELMSAADAACYKAKEEGRNRYHIYKYDDEELASRRGALSWISRIQEAIQEDNFVLYKQAIKPIGKETDASKLHCEILLRMKDAEENLIGPDQFIPAAERYNLMKSVDKWVIEKTFSWLSSLGNNLGQINLCSINLSGSTITDSSIASYIIGMLKKYNLPAEIICFEITETVAITNLVKATQFLDELHQQGVCFALDDFGSGVSSFGYLKNLPVDYLKIDGQFVKDITTNPINRSMVKSINEIGQVMGKKTIAEYVEDQQTVEMLEDIGVDFIQGYVYSRPAPIE